MAAPCGPVRRAQPCNRQPLRALGRCCCGASSSWGRIVSVLSQRMGRLPASAGHIACCWSPAARVWTVQKNECGYPTFCPNTLSIRKNPEASTCAFVARIGWSTRGVRAKRRITAFILFGRLKGCYLPPRWGITRKQDRVLAGSLPAGAVVDSLELAALVELEREGGGDAEHGECKHHGDAETGRNAHRCFDEAEKLGDRVH